MSMKLLLPIFAAALMQAQSPPTIGNADPFKTCADRNPEHAPCVEINWEDVATPVATQPRYGPHPDIPEVTVWAWPAIYSETFTCPASLGISGDALIECMPDSLYIELLRKKERKIQCGGYFLNLDSPHWWCNTRSAHISVYLNRKYHVITTWTFDELLESNWPIRFTFPEWATRKFEHGGNIFQ